MVGILQQFQGSALAQSLYDILQGLQVRECIARALKKQHRDFHLEEVLGALVRGAIGGMQRKGEECESSYAGERGERLRLGGHASAERPAARDERQIGGKPGRLSDGCTNRRMTQRGLIRTPGAAFHVGELIAERRY